MNDARTRPPIGASRADSSGTPSAPGPIPVWSQDDDARLIGPYRIVETLGRGGMGIVYRAQEMGSGRVVALKTVLSPSPGSLDGIRREIQALTRIRHPGVVHLLASGLHQGRPWYAMDFLDGDSLRRFGSRMWSRHLSLSPPLLTESIVSRTTTFIDEPSYPGPDPVQQHATWQRRPAGDARAAAAAGHLTEVIDIVRQLCEALAYLHGEGFIDCDLTPDNVVLVGGKPVIIDLGLAARHPGGSGRETGVGPQPGQAGTVPYMSPELIRRELVDARSDLYAVGCLLYELVVGRPPFFGPSMAVRHQHLSAAPVSPSQLVDGVPPALEQLIGKLLAKDLVDRYGYADEVAAELAELGGPVLSAAVLPRARPYLYRPRFVGRDAIVTTLVALRNRLAEGAGSLVLLAGESGVGKTRVAMEVTRTSCPFTFNLVTGEASALASESTAAVGPTPLHALRPLLQAIADHCQHGGPETTARLLGHRRSILALYEPSLAQVPANPSDQEAVPLGAEASRRRLFKYLAEVLAAFAREEPIVWILDDLGWADELTFSFLESLDAEFIASTPVFILGTYRSEEQAGSLAALANQAHVTRVDLPRLDRVGVRQIVSDMLAMHNPPEPFVEFLASRADGNPFFVAEYVRAAVAERVIHRDRHSGWRFVNASADVSRDYESLGLPGSLRALLEHRFCALTQPARDVGIAAAVLGREADVDLVNEVAGVAPDAVGLAIDELLHRYILEEPDSGRLRFAHDQLRDVAWRLASPAQLVLLHGRAATAIERRLGHAPEAQRYWATLGHHFSLARAAAPAARYLGLAANHARSTFANGEAVRLYEEAIGHARQVLLWSPEDAPFWQDEVIAQQESLADVLSLMGRRDDARAAYEQAFQHTPVGRNVAQARLHRKLGKTWEVQHEHREALCHYSMARSALPAEPDGGSTGEVAEWIQVQIEQLWVHYWRNDVGDMDATIARLRPNIERFAAPLQQANFFQIQTLFNFRRDRYLVSEETIRYARAAVDSCRAGGDLALTEPPAQFTYGFALLFQRSYQQADAELRAVLASAMRSGDTGLQARCLTYLTLSARMRGLTAETTELSARAARAATSAGMVEYIAAAQANQAWLSLRRGDLTAAVASGQLAIEAWKQRVFPFQWTALVPVLTAELSRSRLSSALSCARDLLEPTQQYLPGAAADAMARAIRLGASGDLEAARTALVSGIDYLNGTGYG